MEIFICKICINMYFLYKFHKLALFLLLTSYNTELRDTNVYPSRQNQNDLPYNTRYLPYLPLPVS